MNKLCRNIRMEDWICNRSSTVSGSWSNSRRGRKLSRYAQQRGRAAKSTLIQNGHAPRAWLTHPLLLISYSNISTRTSSCFGLIYGIGRTNICQISCGVVSILPSLSSSSPLKLGSENSLERFFVQSSHICIQIGQWVLVAMPIVPCQYERRHYFSRRRCYSVCPSS